MFIVNRLCGMKGLQMVLKREGEGRFLFFFRFGLLFLNNRVSPLILPWCVMSKLFNCKKTLVILNRFTFPVPPQSERAL